MWLMHEKINEIRRSEREREVGRLVAVQRARRELRTARPETGRMQAEKRRADAAAAAAVAAPRAGTGGWRTHARPCVD